MGLFSVPSNTMYQGAKVKEQEHADPLDEFNTLAALKQITISSSVLLSPENEEMTGNKNKFNSERPPSVSITNTHNLSSSVGKIPQIYAPKLAGQLNSVCSKAETTRKKINQIRETRKEIKPNARLTSVPRPRAVLSSPENDEKFGNKNKFISKRPPSAMNTRNLDRYTPSVAEESYRKSGLKQRNPLKSAILMRKAGAGEGRPSPSCKGI